MVTWRPYSQLMLLSNSNIFDSSKCTRIIRTSFKIQADSTAPISTLRSLKTRRVPLSLANRSIVKKLRSNKQNQRINAAELGVKLVNKHRIRNQDLNLKVAVNGADQFILKSPPILHFSMLNKLLFL